MSQDEIKRINKLRATMRDIALLYTDAIDRHRWIEAGKALDRFVDIIDDRERAAEERVLDELDMLGRDEHELRDWIEAKRQSLKEKETI